MSLARKFKILAAQARSVKIWQRPCCFMMVGGGELTTVTKYYCLSASTRVVRVLPVFRVSWGKRLRRLPQNTISGGLKILGKQPIG